MLFGFVNAHGTAQEDEGVVFVQGWLGVRLSIEVNVADAKAFFFEQGIKCSKYFPGDVLKNNDFLHNSLSHNGGLKTNFESLSFSSNSTHWRSNRHRYAFGP